MQDDQELIGRGRRGDLVAFNVLVERYQVYVYNAALRMAGDTHVAEDMTQEAFISAFRSLKGFRGGDFRSWLLHIVVNKCRDYFRGRGRHRDVSLEEATESGRWAPQGSATSPEDYTILRELGQEIRIGLGTLSQEQREPIVMVDLQGLSYGEAAKVLGISLGTLKSRISRGRASLRDYLLKRRELLPEEFRPKE